MIDSFRGPYRFLSNFYPATIELHDIEYPTVEHAYQAAKGIDGKAREYVRQAPTPGEAKRRGRDILKRGDWDEIKLGVMENLLRQKFASEPLRSMLLATGNQELVEGNNWGDRFWGRCGGEGENHLGELLMKIRSDLRC